MAGERHVRGMGTACYVWIGLYLAIFEKFWEPQPPEDLTPCPGLYRDYFSNIMANFKWPSPGILRCVGIYVDLDVSEECVASVFGVTKFGRCFSSHFENRGNAFLRYIWTDMSFHTVSSPQDHHLTRMHHENLKAYKSKYAPLVTYNATKTCGGDKVINPHILNLRSGLQWKASFTHWLFCFRRKSPR